MLYIDIALAEIVKQPFCAVQEKLLLQQANGGQTGTMAVPEKAIDQMQTDFDSVTYLSFPVCNDAINRMLPVCLVGNGAVKDIAGSIWGSRLG